MDIALDAERSTSSGIVVAPRPNAMIPNVRCWRFGMPAVLAPSLLAAANVVGAYAASASHWSAAVRALGASIVLGMVIGIICFVLFRRPGHATAASSFVILILIGYPLGSIVIGGWAVFAQWQHIHRRSGPTFPEWSTTQFAAGVLAATAAFAVIGGAFRPADFALGSAAPARSFGETGANIYLLMLDGYPRADTLREAFGYDNSTFIESLRALGFAVYANATSPTTRSERSLLSLLSTPDETGQEEPEGWTPSSDPSFRRDTRVALASAGGVDLLRDAGYRLVYIPSQIKHTEIRGWDVTLDSGHLNDLELALLERSHLLAPLVREWVLDQQRDRIEATFASMTEQATHPGKKVLLAHVVAPHPPLVFAAEIPPCWPTCTLWGYHRTGEPEFAQDYVANLEELNRRTVAALDSVLRTDPDATVVVFSDHGIREGQEPDEWHRSLLAARGTTVLDGNPTVAHLFYRLATMP